MVVSSYATSFPAAVKTRRMVVPVQKEPRYNCAQSDTTKESPALAVTPQAATLATLPPELSRLKTPQNALVVGTREGAGMGTACTVDGTGEGKAEGVCNARLDGATESRGVGSALGTKVKTDDGTNDGFGEGKFEGAGVGANVTAVMPAPEMAV